MHIAPNANQQTVRVLLAEAQPLVRRGLRTVLSQALEVSIVAEAADGIEAVRLALLWRPDIVLMDIMLPRLTGCAIIGRIVAECPGTHVVVMTASHSNELVYEVISSGAEAYLLKDASEQEIISAIRAVMRYGAWLAPQVASKVLKEFRRIRPMTDTLAAIEPLTIREERILGLVIEGRSNKEIAATILLAEGTVKNYVSRIMEKLNVRTRTELAVKGLRRPARSPIPPTPDFHGGHISNSGQERLEHFRIQFP